MTAGGGRKAVLTALAGNAMIGAAKFAAWTFTGSAALLAEALHSATNAGDQLLLAVGVHRARKAADDERQFGSGRERYFWSFAVGVVLFVLAAAFSMYSGVERILDPKPVDNPLIALFVLALGIVVGGFTFRTALVAAIPDKGDLSWWQYIRRAGRPELPVVLLEEFGAQVGLIIALVALIIAEVTDNPVWDGIGSLAVGILLFAVALVLLIEMRSQLIAGTAGAGRGDTKKIKAAILSRPEVLELRHLRTQHLGPDGLLVAARIEFDGSLSMDELADAVRAVERTVQADVPHARPMYVEPDLGRFGSDRTRDNGEDDNEDEDNTTSAAAHMGPYAETVDPSELVPDSDQVVLGADVEPNADADPPTERSD